MLTDEARHEKREINNYLKSSYPQDMMADLRGSKLSITIFYFLKTSYGARDLDNLEKTSIDGIFKYFKLNDNTVVNKVTSKRRVSYSDTEYILYRFTKLPDDSKIEYTKDEVLSLVGGS